MGRSSSSGSASGSLPPQKLMALEAQFISIQDLAQRLQVPSEVVASAPDRAQKIVAQAAPNQVQDPPVDSGVGITMHHVGVTLNGISKGAGAATVKKGKQLRAPFKDATRFKTPEDFVFAESLFLS